MLDLPLISVIVVCEGLNVENVLFIKSKLPVVHVSFASSTQFATFQSARSPNGSRSKRELPVRFSVHLNHFQNEKFITITSVK